MLSFLVSNSVVASSGGGICVSEWSLMVPAAKKRVKFYQFVAFSKMAVKPVCIGVVSDKIVLIFTIFEICLHLQMQLVLIISTLEG